MVDTRGEEDPPSQTEESEERRDTVYNPRVTTLFLCHTVIHETLTRDMDNKRETREKGFTVRRGHTRNCCFLSPKNF